MTIQEYFHLVFTDYTLRTITLGTAALGVLSGMLGSFAVLRKESLLGDAISHAALPGIVLAFMITGAKDSGILLLGALISGLLGILWIRGITAKTHLKSDTALGLVLSVFFGIGMLLLTAVQKLPDANQAGLDKYLFGQAATLVESDVRMMLIVLGISLLVMLVYWKEFKIMLFDPEYTLTLGFNIKYIDVLISFFIVLAIVLGLQTVGVVLMSAILLAPAAAARQWTDNLATMVILAGILGGFSGVAGTAVSASQSNLSTGPVIVLTASAIVLFSMIFAPKRGLLFRYFQFRKNRRNLKIMKTFQLIHELSAEDGTGPETPAISGHHPQIKQMKSKGWIKKDKEKWIFTPAGLKKAGNLFNQKSER